jgi:ORF6N domain-containing protein
MRRKKVFRKKAGLPVSVEVVERRIYLIRKQKVMMDADLAKLYGVPTKRLNQQVQRNTSRFPDDFMFQLEPEEVEVLRLQNATSNDPATPGRGGRRTSPYAFTEHGVAMLSAVLNSKRAVEMSILIVRAFVRMRELLTSNRELAARVESLESGHSRHASVINILAEEIEELKAPKSLPQRRRIGFHAAAGR